MANKTALTVIVSVILTVILISLVNVGMSIFLEGPDFGDYCGAVASKPIAITAEICEADGGTWVPMDIECFQAPCNQGYCEPTSECREKYDMVSSDFDQYRYYVFAGIGFLFLLVGLFAKENMVQFTGLASGGFLVMQGIVVNWDNKWVVFISLLAILVIFGILASRIIKKK